MASANYTYNSLAREEEDGGEEPLRPVPKRRKLWRATALAMLLALVIFFSLLAISKFVVSSPSSSCDGLNGFTCNPEISHWLGQYSPYYSVPSEIPTSVPENCEITFAQTLSRHGARDPTNFKTIAYGALIASLKSKVKTFDGKYAFLKNYRYKLGADQLTVLGEQQMVNAGIKFYERYKELAQHTLPFVRTAGQDRVALSATNWTQGFHQALVKDKSPEKDSFPYEIVVMSEGSEFNNTLSIETCPAFSATIGTSAQNKWLNTFVPPIVARLNSDLPGAGLLGSQIISFMDLCPFETVASPTGAISRFCDLFTETEWHQYDYYQSLGKYYGFGPGNPLGPTKGVGYVNELIARMTNTPVKDSTSTNHTLNDDPKTFPIDRNHTLFADFSHDNDMMNIFAAFGLYNSTKPLSNITFEPPEKTNGFSASWTVPFAGRAYFEKLQCRDEKEEFVRILVNDRVMKLETCKGDENGLCKLSTFVESLSFARAGGLWETCYR